MRTIPYDATRDALYHPDLAASIFPVEGRVSEELLCAESARLVYKHFERTAGEKAQVDQALRSVGFNVVSYFARGSTQAFAARNAESDTALVAFRGTEPDDVMDLADDLNALWTAWPQGGRVHKGFKRALELVRKDVVNWIEQHRPRRLLLTGHSLGAALSTLLASLRNPDRLVTFGSPAVGDHDFAATLPANTARRYVDCCDLVTRVPPENFGFEHVGTRLYINSLGQVIPNATEDHIKADRRAGREDYFQQHAWKKGNVAIRDLADHAPINYVYALRP
ncbi:MAG TPA: lipase family protein [Thermoanaerobaculia bacterium]|jgi:pimeloyl-ACP methyl ester carboxylesterase|nr:lipase family protein [Thermoanaerobaculia bacterium]